MPHSAKNTLTRQLGWLIQAPALLRRSPFRDAGSLLRREFLADPTLLHRAAEQLQTQAAPSRLGLIFELWVAALVDASTGLERVASNLPVREQGRTLGELDMLVRDCLSGELWHWELALKFYLATAEQWYGPNRHDTLHRKAQHLYQQQLPRSRSEVARAQLAEQGWEINGQALLTRGRLFYHHDTPSEGEMPAAGHERGWWRTTHELDEGPWSIIDRPFWATPFMSDKEATFVDRLALINYVETHSRPLMATSPHHDQPGFIVPVSWPSP
ncbi:DUF1853 family protein [Alcanivorax sp.]|jgi:hypothetical protein|uniref:DUF1853 family protein n=1 Tax=Alcanivorax sp. TaxID=1872427 RepID=UPI0032D93B7B